MRYHYEKPKHYSTYYGKFYICEHPLYDCCTLFEISNKGLAVIQQRFDEESKSTYWTEIDDWLCDRIYTNQYFREYFDSRAKFATDGLYPTVTVRQIMYALKMKPLPKERWETVFDRKYI